MINDLNRIRDGLLWLSVVSALIIVLFIGIGYEACYKSSFCYEINSVFGIYNYAYDLLIVSVAVALAAFYSRLSANAPSTWLIFTVLWVPFSFFLTSLIGSGSNGWIPTSPNSSFVLILLFALYLFVSLLVLRHRS